MEKVENQSFWLVAVKGAVWALCASLVLILVFAFMLRFFGFGETAIVVIVEIIKGISVLFGTIMAMKKHKENGFLCGIMIGLFFTIISFLVFSMLDGFVFEFSRTLLNDLIFISMFGGISGIIAVNIKGK